MQLQIYAAIVTVLLPTFVASSHLRSGARTSRELQQEAGVNAFILVDAETNQDIGQLKNGDKISIKPDGSSKLAVRAEAEGDFGSIRFKFNGDKHYHSENEAPYALGGHTAGDYSIVEELSHPGSFTLVAFPKSKPDGKGKTGMKHTIRFTTTDTQAIEVTDMILVNADTDEDIGPLAHGLILDFAVLGTKNLNIRAETNGPVGSVVFDMDRALVIKTENAAPFALGGDTDGDYKAVEQLSDVGPHTIRVTAFTEVNGAGTASNTFRARIFFVETPSTVHNLVLMNAETDEDIVPLSDGEAIELAVSDEALTIRADTSYADYVIFDFDETEHHTVQNRQPFLLAGMDEGGCVPVPELTAGEHTVSATPCSTTGSCGTPVTINFFLGRSTTDVGLCGPAPDVVTPQAPNVGAYSSSVDGTVSGELRTWHKITIGFQGPHTCEQDIVNPFTDYRLDVTFTNDDGESFVVPGYYAADGNAANSGATSGNVWLTHFAPNIDGQWTWSASFTVGRKVAQVGGGSTAGYFDGRTGVFDVQSTNKSGVDLRGKGLLQYVGEHHLRFAGNGEWFLKAGSDSPENFLAYEDFDNTPNNKGLRKSWSPHQQDYESGDPTWAGGKGSEIIGAVNYLSNEGMNAFSFLTFNVDGDDENVFPYITDHQEDFERFDVSKLAQWEVVFEHADKKGMFLHFKTMEKENDQMMDGGDLGMERKLYYRELVARFGHHLALNWNLGEETTADTDKLEQFSDFFKDIDPYHHPIVVHTFPLQINQVYTPLLGYRNIEGASVQTAIARVHSESIKWLQSSDSTGHKWVVPNDEQGPSQDGVVPDNVDRRHSKIRKNALWGNIIAGGAGVEYYFGYSHIDSDMTCEDFRTRAIMWKQSKYALDFFRDHEIPFWNMSSQDDTIPSSDSIWALAENDTSDTIVLYLNTGIPEPVRLPGEGSFSVQWFNPSSGGALQNGSVTEVMAGEGVDFGNPPRRLPDWVVLLRRN